MIAASLSLADDPTLLDSCAKMLEDSVKALPLSMEAMAPDGCYPEGTGYWNYGVSFNVFAIAMLESACGTDFGLSGLPGFMETAEYPNAVTGPTGLTIGYSDCGSVRGAMRALWNMSQDSGRWSLLRLNTFGHNVPRIGGAQQCVNGAARFESVVERPSPKAVVDLSSLYPAAKKVTRIVELSADGRKFVVADSFEGLNPGEEVVFQFVLKAKSEMNGGELLLSDGGQRVAVVRAGSEASDWSVAPAEAEKPLNSPNPGFSIASFMVHVGADGRAFARAEFSVVSASANAPCAALLNMVKCP